MGILIKNGTIITSSEVFHGDISIKDEKIQGIASHICGDFDTVMDAEGKLVIPGGVDAHTHFRLPVKGTFSADDFICGSRAGICGGVTTYIDFAHQRKGESPMIALKERINEAEGETYGDFGLHLGITDFNQQVLKEIPEYIKKGVPSFKLYMIYAKEGFMSDDATLYAMLTALKPFHGMVTVHAENPFIIDYLTDQLQREGKIDIPYHPLSRPNFVEEEAIRRAIYLARITEGRIYIVHMTTKEGVDAVREARGQGVNVFAETCPQYLTLTDEIYSKEDGHLYPTCPPLRKEEDKNALWNALAMGVVQTVATDHCSFTREQKEVGRHDFTKLPMGLPGIETLVPLLYSEGVATGRITLNQWVDAISTAPAKLFGLHPRKGSLTPGSDGDLVIFDPQKEWVIEPSLLHYNVDYSPFRGMKVTGKAETTILRGNILYHEGKFVQENPLGLFVPRYYY